MWLELRAFIWETVVRWRALDPELLAAGLSYFSLFSLAPLLLVVLTFSHQILSRPAAQQLILDRISLWMSDDAVNFIQNWMDAPAAPHSHGATFLGLMIAALAGSQVLGYMKRILNRIWDTRRRKKMPPWKDWLSYWGLNLVMLAALGLFLILSLLLDMLAVVIWKFFRDTLPETVLQSAAWLQGINFAASLFGFCLLFALIYRFVPDTSMAWEDVWAGALFTSILLAIGKVCVSLYVNYAAFASGYGAASSVFILVAVDLYRGQYFYFWQRVYANLLGTFWFAAASAQKTMMRVWVRWGSFFMLTGVVAGAFGAHALKNVLSDPMKAVYETGVRYQLIHGLGLFIMAWLSDLCDKTSAVCLAGTAFCAGIILFSGSLYLLGADGSAGLGIVTPQKRRIGFYSGLGVSLLAF